MEGKKELKKLFNDPIINKFISEVMRETKGKANPLVVRKLITIELILEAVKDYLEKNYNKLIKI